MRSVALAPDGDRISHTLGSRTVVTALYGISATQALKDAKHYPGNLQIDLTANGVLSIIVLI